LRPRDIDSDLVKAVQAELRLRGAWVSEIIVQRLIEAGYLLLIFDGLSEVSPDEQRKLSASLKQLGSHAYLVSSRFQMSEFGAVLGNDRLSVELLDVTGDTELRFYTAYTGSVDKANRLLAEVQHKFQGLPHIPLLMKLVATVYNQTGQVPSSRADVFERYFGELVARARTKKAEPEGLLFAIRQLTKETFLVTRGERRGFPEDRGIDILSRSEVALKNRGVIASPLEILNQLASVGIYVRNRHYFSAGHDMFEDYFAACVLDREFDENIQPVLACRSYPKLGEVWELLRELRPEVDKPDERLATARRG
jgi:hypothetical protein